MTVQSKELTSAGHTSPTTTDTGTKVKRYLERKVVEERGLNGGEKRIGPEEVLGWGVWENERKVLLLLWHP